MDWRRVYTNNIHRDEYWSQWEDTCALQALPALFTSKQTFIMEHLGRTGNKYKLQTLRDIEMKINQYPDIKDSVNDYLSF